MSKTSRLGASPGSSAPQVQAGQSSPAGQGESGEIGLADGLRDGWAFAEFGEVASIESNLVSPADFPNHPHVAPDNVEKGSGRLLGFRTIAEDGVTSNKNHFFPGQIVYSKIRPYLSKVIIAEFEGLCSADMYPISTSMALKYLYRFMLSQTFLNAVQAEAGNRVVLPKVNQKQLNAVPVPVPPQAEQLRIVSAIESLQERSSRAKQALSEVGPLLSQLRQSVLRGAFSGRLTERWRTENPAAVSGHALLARIRTERRERWEAAELAKYEAKGKQPPKNWQDKYKVETELDLTGMPELPETWCYARADEIVDPETVITYGIVQPGKHIVDGVPYIRGKDIEDGKILVDQLLRTATEFHEKHDRSNVCEGDVLLCVIRHLKLLWFPKESTT